MTTTTIFELPSTTSLPSPSFDVSVPPPPPNYENPETLAPLIIGISTVFLSLALLAVILRCYSRVTIAGLMYLEDWLAILAWAISTVMTFFICWSTKTGVGRHSWDIPSEMSKSSKIPSTLIMVTVYTPALAAIKISVLIFYLRLASAMDLYYRAAIILVLAIVFITGVVSTFVNAFLCVPVDVYWNMSSSNTSIKLKCMDAAKIYLSTAVLNVLSDFMTLLLPVRMLWGLRLPQRQKIQVSVVFGVLIVSILRTYYVNLANNTTDYMWYGAIGALWSALEVDVAIICGCLPAIKPLLASWWPSWFGNPASQIEGDIQPKPCAGEGITTIGGQHRSPGIALGFVTKNRSNGKGNSDADGSGLAEYYGKSKKIQSMSSDGTGASGSSGRTIGRRESCTRAGRNVHLVRAYPGKCDIYRGDLYTENDYLDGDDGETEMQDCPSVGAGRMCSSTSSEECTVQHEHHRSSPRGLGYLSKVEAGTPHSSEEHIIQKDYVDIEMGAKLACGRVKSELTNPQWTE
ncbi:hypothetical protein BDZ91DRAFT_432084 [Kalaharituber pfeilii]|nr:hypothetical protein BDZ91DRAFT_432084 [Kalaharituber pfeilii]